MVRQVFLLNRIGLIKYIHVKTFITYNVIVDIGNYCPYNG